MDAPNVRKTVGVELARKKAETRRMASWLRSRKLAAKWKQKELQRIKRVNKMTIAVNNSMQKLVDDFLVVAEAENNDPESAKIWTEKAIREVVESMNALNLEGSGIVNVNRVQSSRTNYSAADGKNN